MGGNPFQSRGCSTCKRRKLGCDLARPNCARCVRSGRTCGGYERYPVFVNCISLPCKTPTNVSCYDSSTDICNASTASSSDLAFVHFTKPPIFVSLRNDAVNDQQLGSIFFDYYRPAGQSVWIKDAVLWSQPSHAQTLAVRAFVLTRVGFFRDDQQLRRAGFEAYGSALRAMQKALNDIKNIHAEETLVAAMCLCIYELYESTSGSETSWLKQAEGLSHLIIARGASSYDSDSLAMMLQGVRQVNVIQSLRKRRSSIFNSLEWQSVPWLRRPKDAYDGLLDIGLLMGYWLTQLDALHLSRTQTREDLIGIRKVLADCAGLEDALTSWRAQLREAFPGTLYHTVREGDSRYDWTISSRINWPAPYEFQSLETSRVMLFYWALKTVLCINIRFMCEIFDESFLTVRTDEPGSQLMTESCEIEYLSQLIEMRKWRESTETAEDLATNIVRGVPYLAGNEHGVWGCQNCLFPLSQARTAFLDGPDWRLDWSDRVLKLVQGRAGVVIPDIFSQIKAENS